MITSATIASIPYLSSSYSFTDKHYYDYYPITINNRLKVCGVKNLKFLGTTGSCRIFTISCSTTPLGTTCERVPDKRQLLVSEFKSLTEPIDRVKRLLHYAAMLPPFDESARLPENRVKGCTTQVWIDARIDQNGKVRFRAYSDSEITKGFCYCLIMMLDGADPDEVVGVRAEDLVELNVGVHGKAQSRVNTWHNVLISMQNRTKTLMAEGQGKPPTRDVSFGA